MSCSRIQISRKSTPANAGFPKRLEPERMPETVARLAACSVTRVGLLLVVSANSSNVYTSVPLRTAYFYIAPFTAITSVLCS